MVPLIPPFYFFIGLAGSLLLHFFFPIMRIIPSPYTYIGIPVMAFAFWIEMKADKQFKEHDTTVKPGLESSVLVTDGAFGITRNPMYLGMVVGLIGLAVLLGTLTPWIAPLFVFFILHYVFIIQEEKQDRATFGKEFEDYCASVRRWI